MKNSVFDFPVVASRVDIVAREGDIDEFLAVLGCVAVDGFVDAQSLRIITSVEVMHFIGFCRRSMYCTL